MPAYTDLVPGGASWSGVLRRHQRLRLTDLEGGACCHLLAFRASQPLERYNMPDSLKSQHTFFLSQGRCAMSDMGRVLLSVVHDDTGWIDTVTGFGDAGECAARFGVRSYQEARNERYRNARDNLLVELGKYGLGERDLHASINAFVKIVSDNAGQLEFVPGHSAAGSGIEFRAELDVLVVLSCNQHPLDPSPTYAPKPVAVSVAAGPAPAADDPCRVSCPQAGRAFELTERECC